MKIVQCCIHAGGIGIVGIYNQMIVLGDAEFRTVVFRSVFGNSLVDVLFSDSEAYSCADGSHDIL